MGPVSNSHPKDWRCHNYWFTRQMGFIIMSHLSFLIQRLNLSYCLNLIVSLKTLKQLKFQPWCPRLYRNELSWPKQQCVKGSPNGTCHWLVTFVALVPMVLPFAPISLPMVPLAIKLVQPVRKILQYYSYTIAICQQDSC